MTIEEKSSYHYVGKAFCKYWKAYGGFRALLGSAYLHGSALISLACYPVWDNGWYDMSLSITPSILGFSLGGYAILLAFGDEDFRLAISGPDPDGNPSPFMKANAAFIHFIVISTIALLCAIVAKAWESQCWFIGFFGTLVTTYSIGCGMASAFAIFHVAGWYDAHSRQKKTR